MKLRPRVGPEGACFGGQGTGLIVQMVTSAAACRQYRAAQTDPGFGFAPAVVSRSPGLAMAARF